MNEIFYFRHICIIYKIIILICTLNLHPAHDGLISDRYQSLVICIYKNKYKLYNNSTIYHAATYYTTLVV